MLRRLRSARLAPEPGARNYAKGFVDGRCGGNDTGMSLPVAREISKV